MADGRGYFGAPSENAVERCSTEGIASVVVNDHTAAIAPAALRAGDDEADGWFPESVAVEYDSPGGDNAPEVVGPAVQVLADTSPSRPTVRQFPPDTFPYAWPAEMDLMARIAGLRLRYRWSDWDRSDLTQDSTKHISVWAKS